MADDNELDLEGTEDGEEGIEHGEDNGEVTSRLAAIEQTQAVQGLLNDPEIRKVLELKKAGKNFTIAEETQEEEQQVDDNATLFDGVEEKDPFRKTLEKLNTFIDKKNSRIEGLLAKLTERLDGVQSVAENVQKKEVVDQIKNAREKHKDFDEFKPQILELAKSIPGTNVEELYILAKHRSGKLKLPTPSTFSEKPESSRGREGASKLKKPQVRPPGRRGFADILGGALKELDLEALEKS